MRMVWAYDSLSVYVVTEDRYAAMAGGERSPFPGGHHWEDVFECDDATISRLQAWSMANPWPWHEMKPWLPTQQNLST